MVRDVYKDSLNKRYYLHLPFKLTPLDYLYVFLDLWTVYLAFFRTLLTQGAEGDQKKETRGIRIYSITLRLGIKRIGYTCCVREREVISFN